MNNKGDFRIHLLEISIVRWLLFEPLTAFPSLYWLSVGTPTGIKYVPQPFSVVSPVMCCISCLTDTCCMDLLK